jgi:cytochrome c oxidase subunit I
VQKEVRLHRNSGLPWKGIPLSDSRCVGLLYLLGVTLFFLVGMAMAVLMRLELATPGEALFSDSIYGRLLTAHGLFMVFFVVLPAIPGVLGNLLLPRLSGTEGSALPGLSLAGGVLFLAGGLLLTTALLKGGVEATWMLLPPFASRGGAGALLTLGAVALAGISLLLNALNLMTSILRRRPPGGSWFELPPFFWSLAIGSLALLMATPMLLALLLLLGVESVLGLAVFDPTRGGDPQLYRRLFWLFARPAAYAAILPALGVVSEIVSAYSGGRLRGSRGLPAAMAAIVVFGFLGAGVHSLTAGQPAASGLVAALAGFLSLIPFVGILYLWTRALVGARLRLDPALVYGGVFIALLAVGGLTGLVLALGGVNPHLHATLFVTGHLHYVLGGGVLAAYLGGIHHWWIDFTGRRYPEELGAAGGLLFFAGINLTFLPQFALGMAGLPRRLAVYPEEFGLQHILSTAGMTFLVLGLLLPLLYFAWSLRFGRAAAEDGRPDSPLAWVR